MTSRRTRQKADTAKVTSTSGASPSAMGRVVGIGASAGGLEALKAFLGAMPQQTGLVFVVVVHLDPTHESLMPELLSHVTGLTVEQARDRQPLETDHVYVIPPNRTLTIDQGLIRVREVVDRRGLRGAIDHFFRSLAAAMGDRAIAIVLSGTGTEGTLGARAVKSEGGMVMAQAPDTASQPGMPMSVIATGLVDVVLAPNQMPEALLAYVRRTRGHGAVPEAPEGKLLEGLAAILSVLRARTKYDFRGYKKGTLQRRIERRMGLQQIDSARTYVDFLKSHPAEVDQLFKDLLIGVTSMFRDPGAFDELASKVLAGLVRERDQDLPIRIWVPGCSTGEEAYSIAILLAEQQAAAQSGCRVQIFATDVDEDALEIARAGVYPESIALDVTPQRLQRFFTREDHRYIVAKSIRESVVFAIQNLAGDPPFSKLDLVSCRNVLIYLKPEVQEKLLALFHFALNPGGYLVLGSAEGVGPREGSFTPVSKRQRIFRRIGPVTRPALEFPSSSRSAGHLDRVIEKVAPDVSLAALADRRLLDHLGPTAALVRANGHIVRFYGAMDRYIKLPTGDATLDLLTLARAALKPTLRAGLHEAVRRNRRTVIEALEVKRDRGRATLRVTVKPVTDPKTAETLWMVIFEEVPPLARPASSREVRRHPDLVRRLEAELRATKKEQQHLIEQLESGNEDLKAANEEVLSMNEELQSTNEELTTSKEELQSMNEELTTLNAQLQDKLHELTTVNDDLANLIVSTDIATVFLDTDLRIKRFTTAASHVLNLRSADTGRPMNHIAPNLVGVDLSRDARSVLDTLAPVEREVVAPDGRQYVMRVLPYRSEGRTVLGVVLTFVDVTMLKLVERELRAAREKTTETLSQMTRLHELGARLISTGDLRSMLVEVLHAAMDITGVDMGHVQECDHAGVLTITAHVGFEQLFLEHFARVEAHTDSACGTAIASRQRVIVEDVTTSAIFKGSRSLQVMRAAGVQAVQTTPLFDRSGRLLGLLSTHYRTPHRFEDDELRWLDVLALFAADVIERGQAEDVLARSHRELEKRVAERTKWLTLMHAISLAINESTTWDDALQRVLHRLCEAEHWQIGHIYLPDPADTDTITATVGWVDQPRFQPFHAATLAQRYRKGQSLPGRVYAEGRPVWVNAQQVLLELLPFRTALAEQLDLASAVALPVRFGPDVVAVLELFSDRPHPPTEQYSELMEDVGHQIGRVVERERSTARMADLVWREQQGLLHTLHDSLGQTLTGLGMLSTGLAQRLQGADAGAVASAQEISRQAQDALEQVRQLARNLFPIEVEAQSLMLAIRDLASATESLHDVRVRVEGAVPDSLRDGKVATQLYRIAQEAITNAVKHAHAQSITIQIDGEAGAVALHIVDDGIGIDQAKASDGMGLRIMRYRASSIGGRLSVGRGTDGGTLVTCTVRQVPHGGTASRIG